MNDAQTMQYYYPNQLGRIILTGMEEVVGQIGVNAVLNQARLSHLIDNYPPNTQDRVFKFEELSGIQQALEEIYGPRGGRGLALRVGRACFKHGLREYGPVLGFTDLAFRLLPLEEKMRTGADIFAEIFNRFSDQRVVVDEDSEYFYWKIERCPVCWLRKTEAPVCHLAVGLLQEALYWVSGGKFFNIEETECIAKGDPACRIVIEKKSLD
jgi:predicted hydrocarbon binding protein